MKFQAKGRRRKLSARVIRTTIERFNKHGQSSHTTQGLTLAPLLNYLVENNVAFQITYVPASGYYVRKFDLRDGTKV